MRDTLTQFGLNLKLTKSWWHAKYVKSTYAHIQTVVFTASFPQMEDDVEVELELEKQVKLMKDEYHAAAVTASH